MCVQPYSVLPLAPSLYRAACIRLYARVKSSIQIVTLYYVMCQTSYFGNNIICFSRCPKCATDINFNLYEKYKSVVLGTCAEFSKSTKGVTISIVNLSKTGKSLVIAIIPTIREISLCFSFHTVKISFCDKSSM